VRLRLVADVPVGVFLSGGLDSSTITSLMCAQHAEPVHTFSIGFPQKSFDESAFSQAVADKLGTVHHHQTLDPETTLAALEPLAESLDEPLADPAIIPTFLLSRFARERVTVALSGEGADELLGGYPTYLAHQLAEPLGLLPAGLWRLAEHVVKRIKPSREYLSFDFKLKKFVSGMGLPTAERHLTWMGSFPWLGDSGILSHPAPQALDLTKLDLPSGLVERAQTLDFHTYLADDLLVKLDRATMMVSLEGRVPFLDHRLIEAMAALPTGHKLRILDAKRVLKRVEASRLPAQVIKRKKKGFGVPLAEWLRGPLRPLLDAYLSSPYLRDQGLFRPEPVARLVSEHLQGSADHRKPLWTLLVFQRWAERYKPTL
jgi:asparagine synthase (glutamine-hydrolysing)